MSFLVWSFQSSLLSGALNSAGSIQSVTQMLSILDFCGRKIGGAGVIEVRQVRQDGASPVLQPTQLRRVNHVGRHDDGFRVGDQSVNNERNGIVVNIDNIVIQFDVDVSGLEALVPKTKVRSVVRLHFAISRGCR